MHLGWFFAGHTGIASTLRKERAAREAIWRTVTGKGQGLDKLNDGITTLGLNSLSGMQHDGITTLGGARESPF